MLYFQHQTTIIKNLSFWEFMQKKTQYLTNKQLLAEIHKCKKSFSYYTDDLYSDYDHIVSSKDEITPELALEVLEKKNAKVRKDPNERVKTDPEEIVFRYMTYEHVPLSDDKKKRSRTVAGQGHLKTNFPPYKHFIFKDGVVQEVGRSHWKNGLDNGEFSTEHGRISDRLARMFILLVDRYARRGNWRNYTYNQEMRQTAVLQLTIAGLVFDESKGDKPFAFYTQSIKHCFIRVLQAERKNQSIRDDLLTMAGQKPSYTRQIENELAHKFADQGTAKPAIKRGRKAKSATKPDEDY